MSFQIYTDYTDEIHPSESYCGNLAVLGTNIILPIINIGISHHPVRISIGK